MVLNLLILIEKIEMESNILLSKDIIQINQTLEPEGFECYVETKHNDNFVMKFVLEQFSYLNS